jgi:hypothetical protein
VSNFRFAVRFCIVLAAVLGGASVTQAAPAAPPAACADCWSGVITYTRTLENKLSTSEAAFGTTDPKSERVMHDLVRNVQYVGKAVVLAKAGAPAVRGQVTFSDREIEKGSVTQWNRCHSHEKDRLTQQDDITMTVTEASAAGMVRDFNLRVAGGVFHFGGQFPDAAGTTAKETSVTQKNFCQGAKPPPPLNQSRPQKVDGERFQIDGTVDLENPDVLTGSKTWGGTPSGGVPTAKYTVQWSLKRKPQGLLLTNIRFADMRFPKWNDWQEVVEQKGTIDGNLVKIKATVLNLSSEARTGEVAFKETYKGDKWDGARPDAPLKDTLATVTVPPGEEREVEIDWDSSGYAWFDDGRPRLVQRVKAELREKGRQVDEMTKNLKVAPKPVLLVHGVWSTWKVFESWQNTFTITHSYDWKAFAVGEKAERGEMKTGGGFMSTERGNTVAENAAALQSYIRYAQEDRNAWHVDIVAHSSGGLVARLYVHGMMPPTADGRPQVAHLLMLGTPNLGSPCADTLSLVYGALDELTRPAVADFNRRVTNTNGVKLSALAGKVLPNTCRQLEWNDGFVTVPSAQGGVKDVAQSGSLHTDLASTANFSSFVKPRLAIGPKGNHAAAPADTRQSAYLPGGRYTGLARLAAAKTDTAARPDFSKGLKLGPKQSLVIDLPVQKANDLGVTLLAAADVSATLLDTQGAVAGANLAKSPEAGAWFRSIHIDRSVAAGTWKLKLENTAQREVEVFVATWRNAGK